MAAGPESARVANPHDATRIGELADEVLAVLAAARGGAAISDEVAALRPTAALAGRLRLPDAGGLVVGEYDRLTVGFAAVDLPSGDRPGGAASVRVFYVEPAMRRVGVGEAMLEEAIRVARLHGATGIDVPALPGDAAMKSFLEAMGMRARLLTMNRSLT